jgi:hypothetical protein
VVNYITAFADLQKCFFIFCRWILNLNDSGGVVAKVGWSDFTITRRSYPAFLAANFSYNSSSYSGPSFFHLDVYLASEKQEKVFICGYKRVYDTHRWSAEETSSALTASINMTRLTCCVDGNETLKNDACGVTESSHVDEVCSHLTDSQRLSLRRRIKNGSWTELKQVASSSHTHLTPGDRLLDFNDVVIVKSDPGTDQLEGYVMQLPADSQVQYECIYRFSSGVCRGVRCNDSVSHAMTTSPTNDKESHDKLLSEHGTETKLILVVILAVSVVASVSGIVIYCCLPRRRQRRQSPEGREEEPLPTLSQVAATDGASEEAAADQPFILDTHL